ncbi:MAG: hypothetical protein AB8B64_23000 [Granulosicoccus sp.]
MTQERQLHPQIEADSYITQAKVLRAEVLASMINRLFKLPTEMMGSLANAVTNKKQPVSTTADKAA